MIREAAAFLAELVVFVLFSAALFVFVFLVTP